MNLSLTDTILKKGITRNIVMLLFLFGIVPIGILSIIFFAVYFDDQKRGIRNVQKEIANRVASTISSSLDKSMSQIRLFTRLNFKGRDPEKLKSLAYGLLDLGLEYDMVTVADLTGRELFKASRHYSFRPFELGFLDEAGDAALRGGVHIGRVEVSRFSKFPRILITLPIRDAAENIIGALQVGVNIVKMWKLISKNYIGKNRYAYIVDSNGTLIAYKDVSSVLEKRSLGHIRGVDALMRGETGVFEYYGLRRNPVIGANAVIPLTSWGVVVEEPVKHAFRRLYNLSAVFISFFLVTVVFAVILGLNFSFKGIVRPIRRLQEEARFIARGDFSRKIHMNRSDELGQLADSFNRMVETLEKTTVSRDKLIREIQERKRTEEALKASEKNYREIFDAVNEAIFVHDMVTGAILDVNRTMRRMYGCPDGEDASFSMITPASGPSAAPFSAEDASRWMKKAVEEGPQLFEWLAWRADGERFWVEVNLKRVVIGGQDRLLAVVRDITERKQAEEALKRSEAMYRNVVENSLHPIMISQDRKIKFANGKASELSGYSRGELMNLADFLQAVHPDDHGKVLRHHEARLRGESVPDIYTFRFINKAGEAREVEVSGAPTSFEGRPAILNFFNDVTELKKAAEAKARLEEQLRRSEKMEAIGALAGGVAHDLNNILSGIVSYPELMLLDLPEDSPMVGPVLTMQRSGKKAADIVQDLLTLARRGVAITDVVNLNEIILDFLDAPEFRKLSEHHPDVEFKTFLDPALMNIKGSPVHLGKTVMNLASNAAEAMPDGGVVEITTTNRYLDRPVKGYDEVTEGDYVVMVVADSGMGIEEEDQIKIFEPFYTKKVMGRSGTGLGMAVVWGTVKDHDGYIDVKSREGEGATFVLYFPVTREEAAEAGPGLSIDDYMGRGESILVVDDVEEQRRIACDLLGKLGYSATAAASGEEAVERLETGSADLLVLDMIMEPGIDGLETYRRIIQTHPGQKAIIASGFSETGHVRKAQELGAGQYIKKPYTLEKIGLAVRRELDGVGHEPGRQA